MNLSTALSAVGWLVRDTFRQSLATGAFWLLLAATGLCAAFCLTVGHTERAVAVKDDRAAGLIGGTAAAMSNQQVVIREQTFLFGTLRNRYDGPREAQVRRLYYYVGGLVAQTLGLVLVLTFTAGFLPSFVDPNAAHILFTKPVARWAMLLGKFLGVVVFLAVHVVIFVLATWVALGISTGEWPVAYMQMIPTLLLHYLIYFSISAMLAVTTRNTAACVIGAVLFWLLCWGMNVGRHAVVAYDLEQFSAFSRFLSEAGYWILPKPADVAAGTWGALNPEPLSDHVLDLARVQEKGKFCPTCSMAASLIFAAVIVAVSGHQLETTDY